MSTISGVDKPALSIDEATTYLGIQRAFLYRLLESRSIESFHIGRRRLILRSELDRFINQRVEAENGRDGANPLGAVERLGHAR